MRAVKIVIGRRDGTVERGIVMVREGARETNAIVRYGTAMQEAYGDIAGISHRRGYLWIGHGRRGEIDCPALLDWTDMTRPHMDAETWDARKENER
ncbi:MAG: hypothetical protein WC455_29705 [Dehalococcoidia bacterium]|jgi:hypothetical protein